MSAPVVDTAVVQRLIALLGADDGAVPTLFATHRAHAGTLLDRMRQAARRLDGPEIRAQAHSLRGAGATLGAGTVVVLCRRLEDGEVPPAGYAAAVEALAIEHARFCAQVEPLLGEQPEGASRSPNKGTS